MKKKMLAKAIEIATKAHIGQFDRGGNPYILHPMAVMHLTGSDDEEIQSIAILHDVVEDTHITYSDLKDAGMSERVIAGVKALTKYDGQTYEEYQVNVLANRDAKIVKMADLEHNSDIRRLKGVTEKDIARTVKYQKFYRLIKSNM